MPAEARKAAAGLRVDRIEAHTYRGCLRYRRGRIKKAVKTGMMKARGSYDPFYSLGQSLTLRQEGSVLEMRRPRAAVTFDLGVGK